MTAPDDRPASDGPAKNFHALAAEMAGAATSVGPVIERDGFKWMSVATPGLAPGAPEEARILHHDGRNLFAYHAVADRLEFDQPAIDLSESLFVIEGLIERHGEDGSTTVWRSGDFGHHDYHRPCRMAFGAGTRLIRYVWSDAGIGSEAGRKAGGPLPGSRPRTDRSAAPTVANIHADHRRWIVSYHDEDVVSVPIHEDPDRRRSMFFALDVGGAGVAFDDPPCDVFEVIYVTQGSMEIEPEGLAPLKWVAGDFVFWPYDRPQRNRYSVGLGSLCYFWAGRALPDFRNGEETGVMRTEA